MLIRGRYSIGYYPNSRTSIKLSAEAGYNQYWGTEQINENEETDVNQTIAYGGLNLGCYYYISPRLRFNLDVYSNYQFSRDKVMIIEGDDGFVKSNDLHSSLSAGLVYSIF